MQTCLFCKDPVLGLIGNDDLLDPVNFSTADADLVANKIYGECHSSCLIASSWAERWASILTHSLVTIRGYKMFEIDNARICINAIGTSALVELKDSHRCVAINASSLAQETKGSKHVFVEHEVNWELSNHVTKFDSEVSHQINDSPISLKLIARLFGVQSHYSDSVLESGFLTSTQDTADNLRLGHLSGSCRYPLDLPEQVIRFLMETIFELRECKPPPVNPV